MSQCYWRVCIIKGSCTYLAWALSVVTRQLYQPYYLLSAATRAPNFPNPDRRERQAAEGSNQRKASHGRLAEKLNGVCLPIIHSMPRGPRGEGFDE